MGRLKAYHDSFVHEEAFSNLLYYTTFSLIHKASAVWNKKVIDASNFSCFRSMTFLIRFKLMGWTF